MKSLRLIAVVLVLGLLTSSLVSAQASFNPGAGSVNFTVMNMDTVEEATVVATYISTNGTVAATVNKTLDTLSSDGFNIADAGLPATWQGSVIVSSNTEIVAFAQATWTGGTSGDGKTAGAYNGFVQGATTLYFPSLAARATQFSRISIQSAEAQSSTEQVNFTIQFYSRDGSLVQTVNGSVNKGAQKSYDLMADVDLPDNWLGAAVVTSVSPIAGVTTMHWTGYSAAYSAVLGGGTTAYVPSATRRINSSGAWLQFTALIVQNLESDDASVTVKWYDRSGNELHSFNDTIPANSSLGYNTRYDTSNVPNHAALFAALGNDWNGSVVITSDKNIVAVPNLQWTSSSPVGLAATAYTSEPAGYAEVFAPASFRRVNATTSEWIQFTGLIVQNVGASACNNFTVQWRDRSGAMLLQYTDSLNSNISAGYNTRYPDTYPSGSNPSSLGNDFRGSVYIDAPGCELVAVHNTLWPLQTDSTTYNAFGK